MTTSDGTPTRLCLQAGKEIFPGFVGLVFERMIQVASTGARLSVRSHTLFSDAVLIPPVHTHSTIMGLQFVLPSHHLELLYQVVSTSIEFRVSSEPFGKLVCVQTESRVALYVELFAR